MNQQAKADRMILGAKCAYSTDCEETGLNNNVLVCGGSGSGKTMSVTEPRLLETFHTSLIATVTKRRIVNKYAPMFEERGYQVLDLNFADPAASTVCYDPLAYVHDCADIHFLAEAIVRGNAGKAHGNLSDPFWDSAAISLLSAEIACTLCEKKNATFADVLDLHESNNFYQYGDTISSNLEGRFDLLDGELSDYACSCWQTFIKLPYRTASCVYSTLNTTIDTLFSPELREMIRSCRRVSFRDIACRKTVLFVTTSAVNPALGCFVNMFYAQAFKQLFEFAERRPDGVLPLPVHMICDDFATGGRIHNFAEYISIFREKRISVTLLLQSESQLEAMYGPGDATTIINNCDSYVYLGGMDLRTAQNVSIRLNAPLEDVLYLPIGGEILFRRGQKPIRTTRYDVRSDERYRRVTERYERQLAQPRRAATFRHAR